MRSLSQYVKELNQLANVLISKFANEKKMFR